MILINIVGWHISNENPCHDCGKPAVFLVISALDDDEDFFSLCRDCMDPLRYVIHQDLVGDALNGLERMRENNMKINGAGLEIIEEPPLSQ